VNNLTRDEARQRARCLAVTGYEVELDLTTGEETFASRTTARFTAVAGGSTFIEHAASALSSVELNGTSLDPAEVFDDGRITLAGLAAVNTLEIVSTCAYSNTGEGLHRFVDPVDGNVYLHTQLEPYEAHRIFACFDQPDLKAPLSLTVVTPADWVAVSATIPTSTTSPGGTTWTFPATAPISSYLYALVAGPYAHVHADHDGIPLGLYCRQSLREHLDVDELFVLTRQGFDFFHGLFGIRHPFAKYDQLFVPELNAGAMENVGCVTFSEDHLFRSKVTRSVGCVVPRPSCTNSRTCGSATS
jgi:aminopeptidase N